MSACILCKSNEINNLELGDMKVFGDLQVHYFCLVIPSIEIEQHNNSHLNTTPISFVVIVFRSIDERGGRRRYFGIFAIRYQKGVETSNSIGLSIK